MILIPYILNEGQLLDSKPHKIELYTNSIEVWRYARAMKPTSDDDKLLEEWIQDDRGVMRRDNIRSIDVVYSRKYDKYQLFLAVYGVEGLEFYFDSKSEATQVYEKLREWYIKP